MVLSPALLTTALTLPVTSMLPSKKWKEILYLAHKNSYSELVSFLQRQGCERELKRLDLDWLKECQYFLKEQKCLSFFCELYPARWKEVLGNYSPPSIWWNQQSFLQKPSLSIVGSRNVSSDILEWTQKCASFFVKQGFLIISGGAIGVDQASARGSLEAGQLPIEILPFGLKRCSYSHPACRFSVSPLETFFSIQNAMIRNQLIYAFSLHTVVVHSKYKEGGTWHGAINALKKNLARVHVWDHPENKGAHYLMDKGAISFKTYQDLLEQIQSYKDELRLF